jgi:diadenosine tetraphosphate (Ap4A) HIT family hydrolase
MPGVLDRDLQAGADRGERREDAVVAVAPGVSQWREDRIGAALRGENPMVMARMRSGFAVIGDTQHLPGYSLLLCDDASINHLTDLDWPARAAFLFDLSLVGEAVQAACHNDDLRRINYEILGNAEPWLHGHVHPRYDWEPADHLPWPVSRYPPAIRNAREHAYSDDAHGELRSRITRELQRLMAAAYVA